MLDFAIFAVTLIVVLIVAVIYLYPSSRKVTTIPGLDRTSAEDGNLADINRAGSLHEFLVQQHSELGPITSFWIGDEFVVSIASPSLLKQHINVFDTPVDLYRIMVPVFGVNSIIYQSGADGRALRHLYDKSFHHENLHLYSNQIQKIASEMCNKWSTLMKEEHVGLMQYMSAFATKAVLQSIMGHSYFIDDKEILAFKRNYDQVWLELETRSRESLPGIGSLRELQFTTALQELQKSMRKVVDKREQEWKEGAGQADALLIDHIIAAHRNKMDSIVGECLAYIITGISRTTSLLVWCFYFLASHPEIQNKLYTELLHEFKSSGAIEPQNIFTLKYLRQVIDETLRCAVVIPWTARIQDFDTELGGHKIPKKTAIIHALGVVMKDETIYPVPNKFDPDRFNATNSQQRDTLAFSPFGFAGRRYCPAKDWVYLAAVTLVANLVQKLDVKLVQGQVVIPVYGLVTLPMEEIWVTVHKQKS